MFIFCSVFQSEQTSLSRMFCITLPYGLSSDPRQIYDDLKDQLSKVFKTLKTLETRASKPNFSTEELSSRVSTLLLSFFVFATECVSMTGSLNSEISLCVIPSYSDSCCMISFVSGMEIKSVVLHELIYMSVLLVK